MNSAEVWHNAVLGKRTVAALQKNNFQAEYVESGKEAVKRVLDLIPSEAVVGLGGSVTISQLGIQCELEKRGNKLLIQLGPGITAEESLVVRRKMLTTDIFLCSTNAITLDGKLVNVDGMGNRVAAMIFGRGKVLIVAGVNKIVKDVDSALERIEMNVAPVMNKQRGRTLPCTVMGLCMDCQDPSRTCNITAIIRKKPWQTDITVIIVGENLGY